MGSKSILIQKKFDIQFLQYVRTKAHILKSIWFSLINQNENKIAAENVW